MTSRSDFVFLGPSLPAAEAVNLLPGALVRPPVQPGDLLGLDARPGDRVLIVDGVEVSAKEIRELLARGVLVAGAAGIGAVRAAELAASGMRGSGEVYRLYAEGVVTGLDEVAVVYGPAEEGYRPLSEALVNIRITLRAAAADRVVSGDEAAVMLALAAALPVANRGYRALDRLTRADIGFGCAGRFAAWLAEHPMDIKRADTRALLRNTALVSVLGR